MSRPTIMLPPQGPIYPTPLALGPYSTASIAAATSALLVAANPRRKGYSIWNNSANSCYFHLTSPASGSTPVRIQATFTSWEVVGPAVFTGAIYAIRNAGTGIFATWELI